MKYVLITCLLLSACATPQVLATPVSNTIYITGDGGTYSDLIVNGTTSFYGIKITGNNNTIINPKITGAVNACIYVEGNGNSVTGLDCSSVISDTGTDPDQNGITVFGDSNKFTDINIHDITCTGNNHCDGVQTWRNSLGVVGTNTELTGIINIPGQSSAALNKCIQGQDGSSWNIHNLVCIASLGSGFVNSSGTIINSTFIGSGIPQPQGIKFGTSTFTVTNNIFAGFTSGGGAFFPTSYPGNLISGNNCYFNDASRPADPNDVLSDPLFTSDYYLQSGSPCAGMGAFPVPEIEKTATFTETATNSVTTTKLPTFTPTNSQTATNHPKKTSTPKPATPTFTITPTAPESIWSCWLYNGTTICAAKGIVTP